MRINILQLSNVLALSFLGALAVTVMLMPPFDQRAVSSCEGYVRLTRILASEGAPTLSMKECLRRTRNAPANFLASGRLETNGQFRPTGRQRWQNA